MFNRSLRYEQLEEYTDRIFTLLQKTDDMNRIEKLGVRYENACRILNEYIKAHFEESNIGKLEAEIV